MREGLAAVLLCVLVASAGCSVLPGGNGAGNGVGGNGEDAVANEVPGVANGSLENSTALLDAHVAAVTESGYSQIISTNLTGAAQGETYPISQRQRTRVAAGASEYRYQTITSGQVSSRIIAWGNRSVEYRRGETAGGEPQYQRLDPQPVDRLAGRAIFDPRLSPEFEVVNVTERENAPDVIKLEVDALPAENDVFDEQEEITDVRQFEAQLVVDTEGRIHSYAAAAVYDIEGTTAEYEYRYQITSFEEPEITRPDWIDEIES